MKPYRILMLQLLLSALMAKAQSPGDYRSVKSGNWNSADTWEVWDGISWNVSFLPPSFSDGQIVIRANHEISSNTPVNIDQVKILGALIVINNTLKIENGAEDADLQVDGSLNLNFGTIEGDGSIEVNGKMTYAGGTINGNIIINPDGILDMTGINLRTLSGSINNNGTINIPDIFTLNCSNATVNNNDGGIMNISVVDGFTFALFNTLGPNIINNNSGGEINKYGKGAFRTDIPSTNAGKINVNDGTFSLNGNTHENSGSINIAANAVFGVVGNAIHTINEGSSFTGTGLYSTGLNGTQGNTIWNKLLSSLNFKWEMRNGTSSGSAITLNNAENFWWGGTINHQLDIASGASLKFTAFAPHILNGTLNNYGNFNWETGPSILCNGAIINNFGNFYFNSQAGDIWRIINGSGTNRFNNFSSGVIENGPGSITIEPETSLQGTLEGTGLFRLGVINHDVLKVLRIRPGKSPGAIEINSNSPLLDDSSVLEIEIQDASGAGIGHDQLRRDGNLVLDGTLNVTETGIVPNGTYTIIELNSGTITGSFNAVTLPAGYSLSTTTTAVNVTKGSLPLHLIAFNGMKKDNNIVLNWQTASEENFSHFEIERSENRNVFAVIGIVITKQGNNEKHDYQFTDIKPFGAINYYRLKMTDRDGKFTYSKVVKVDFRKSDIVSILPNPAKDYFILKGGEAFKKMEIIDMNGIMIQQYLLVPPQTKYFIHHLKQGTYFIRLRNEENVQTLRLIKQ